MRLVRSACFSSMVAHMSLHINVRGRTTSMRRICTYRTRNVRCLPGCWSLLRPRGGPSHERTTYVLRMDGRHHKKTPFPEMPEYTTWVTDGNRALQQLGSECVKLHAHVKECVETLDRTIGQVEKSMSLLSTTFGQHDATEAVLLARLTYARNINTF